MSDTPLSHSLIVGHDLLDDEETYLYDLSQEELGSISGGGLKKIAPTPLTINSIACVKIDTLNIITTAISCTCHPGPQPTSPVPRSPFITPGLQPLEPVFLPESYR